MFVALPELSAITGLLQGGDIYIMLLVNLCVMVTPPGPRGNRVSSTVTNNNNGTYTVEYVPSDVGELPQTVIISGGCT